MKRVESLVKVSPSDSTLALCLRIICTGENAADKSRFPVSDGRFEFSPRFEFNRAAQLRAAQIAPRNSRRAIAPRYRRRAIFAALPRLHTAQIL